MSRGKVKRTLLLAAIVAGLFIAYEAIAMASDTSSSGGATVEIDSENYSTNVINVFAANNSSPGNCRKGSCK